MKKRKAMAAGAGAGGSVAIKVESVDRSVPTEQDIATLAYSFWEARGKSDGSAEEDWLRAESELASRSRAEGVAP